MPRGFIFNARIVSEIISNIYRDISRVRQFLAPAVAADEKNSIV